MEAAEPARTARLHQVGLPAHIGTASPWPGRPDRRAGHQLAAQARGGGADVVRHDRHARILPRCGAATTALAPTQARHAVSTATRSAPAARSSPAQARTVAPDVVTSSI